MTRKMALRATAFALGLMAFQEHSFAVAIDKYTNEQVSTCQTSSEPGFAVIAGKGGSEMHFVWRQGSTFYYNKSTDGRSWSSSEKIGASGKEGRIALDSKGIIHMVFTNSDRIHYCKRSASGWSAPQQLAPLPASTSFRQWVPKIAVDGLDNIHIISWKIVEPPQGVDWKSVTRCTYWRITAAGQVEKAVDFSRLMTQSGGAFSGDLAADANGDIHLAFQNVDDGTYVIRKKGEGWGKPIRTVVTGSDDGVALSVGPDGSAHITGFIQCWGEFTSCAWPYYNNQAQRDRFTLVKKWADQWEQANNIMVAPNGDVWISRGNWNGGASREPPLRVPYDYPKSGRYVYFDAAAKQWSEPQWCSPKGVANVTNKHDQTPKFVYARGAVRLFYAEKTSTMFKFYQRIWQYTPTPVSNPSGSPIADNYGPPKAVCSSRQLANIQAMGTALYDMHGRRAQKRQRAVAKQGILIAVHRGMGGAR